MTTPLTIPASKPTALQLFAQRVANATGLDPLVVTTWVIAEHGPTDNPLNIMQRDEKGRFVVAHFGGWQGAADATVQNLQTPLYAPVLRAAKTGQPKAQLDALAASSWDAGHYRGLDSSGNVIMSNKPGTLLYGIWTTIVGGPPLAGSTHETAADPTSPLGKAGTAIVGGVDAQGNVTQGGIAGVEQWLSSAAVVGLGYVSLTLLALGLILLAAWRVAGPTVMAAKSAGASASTPNMEIPF